MNPTQSRYAREIHTPDAATSRASMVRRDALRRQGQTLLHDKGLPHNKQHRACWCARHVVSDTGITIFRRLDGGRARLAGVKTCGSVWACPVCAAKVAEVRRRELVYAMAQHKAQGGAAYLMTLTFPHYRGQGLADLKAKFAKAVQSFQNAKGWRKVMDVAGPDKPGGTAGRVGSVTSQEVTFGGANGWHPHKHILIFCNPAAFAEGPADDAGRLTSSAIDYFKAQWVHALEKAGLVDGSNRQWALQYGLDMRGGVGAAQYVAK